MPATNRTNSHTPTADVGGNSSHSAVLRWHELVSTWQSLAGGQKALANLLGTSSQNIYRWTTDATRPSPPIETLIPMLKCARIKNAGLGNRITNDIVSLLRAGADDGEKRNHVRAELLRLINEL